MILDPATMDATSCYKILIGSIVPRAIGWVSTASADGVANLAPFSFFTAVCRKPPMVSLTIQPKSDRVSSTSGSNPTSRIPRCRRRWKSWCRVSTTRTSA